MSVLQVLSIAGTTIAIATVLGVAFVVLRSTASATAFKVATDLNSVLERKVGVLEKDLAHVNGQFDACKDRLERLEERIIDEFERGRAKGPRAKGQARGRDR